MPIYVPSRNSTPSPSSSSENENMEMIHWIQVHCTRRSMVATSSVLLPTHSTPSPPSNSPDERTSDGLDQAVHGRMTTTAVTLTATQIHHNVEEDAREYHDSQIDALSNEIGASYSWMFMHGAMVSHWAEMFHKPISVMLTNFSNTPSIAIPAVCNLPPPPIIADNKPDLEYPPLNVDKWEIESIDETPAIPVPPPQHHEIPLEVLDHLHTIHLAPADSHGPNYEPMTPTDPVPSMLSSPPQFLQINPLDPAPPFEQIVNALVQRDVDAQIVRVAREEEEEERTPLPTGPQPNVHPGPGWHVNFEEDAIHYVFQIPSDDGHHEIAPFIMINWDTTSPELLGTCGQGCPVHAKHLHTRFDEFPHPTLDRCQEFFFADNQTHLEGVDWAMGQEGDDTLHAEVICHCALRTKVICHAHQVTEMREQLVDECFTLTQSTCHLACANAYCHLRRHITSTLTPATSALNARHISQIQHVVNSPWNWTDDKLSDECLWCKKEGHKVENCALIHICDLCCARGHLKENCFQPHSHCVSFQVCCVPLLYKHRNHHACTSTIILERT